MAEDGFQDRGCDFCLPDSVEQKREVKHLFERD